MQSNVKYLLVVIGFTILLLQCNTASAFTKKWKGSDTLLHKTSPEAEKYSSLPHTIFAPDGRLYNIEKVAKETSRFGKDNVSSSLVVAIKFGKGDDHDVGDCDGSGVIIISTRHCSDFLLNLRKEGGQTDEKISSSSSSSSLQENTTERLWSYPIHQDGVSMPLSILPSNLLIATGGLVGDAMALHRKILEMALESCREHDNMKSTHQIVGTITASMLAKKVANYIQLPTQSAVAEQSMLASAALVIGWDDDLNWKKSIGGRRSRGSRLSIWRCDSTGQFWNCYAAAVGRGAGNVEAEIMSRVATTSSKLKERCGDNAEEAMDLEELIAMVSPQNVQDYISSLSFDDAVILACQCIKKSLGLLNQSGETIVDQFGVQGVLLHGGGGGGECDGVRRELIYSDILCEAFDHATTSAVLPDT